MLAAPPGPTEHLLGCPVVEGPTPDPWQAAVHNARVLADHDRALVRHGPASLYVAGGSEVVLSTPDRRSRVEHDYLVYAFASRLLLMQRRRFTLHATLVVAPSGAAVAITGLSTVGKSITSVELVRRGWRLACDDVVEVRREGGELIAVPFLRPIHLGDDAARLLGVDPAVGRELPGRDKRVFTLTGEVAPRPLDAVVRLRLTDGRAVQRRLVPPLEALPLLAMYSDPNGLCELPEYRADYLSWAADLASALPVLDVGRPVEGLSVAAVADAVEEFATSR